MAVAPQPQGTPTSVAVNLLATVMGAGILSLPHAFAGTGWLLGLVLLVSMGCICDITLNYLVDIVNVSGQASYDSNVGRYLGPRAKGFVSAAIIVLMLLAAVAFLVIVRDSTPDALEALVGDTWAWLYQNPVVVTFVAGCCVFPLGLMQDTTRLQYTSFVSVCCLMYFFTCLTLRYLDGGTPWMHPSVVAIKTNPRDILSSLAIMASCYGCHSTLCKFYLDLRPESRHCMPQLIHVVILLFVTTIYACAGLMGYFLFGEDVQGDIIRMFDSGLDMTVARGALAVTMLFKIPLLLFPLKTSCEMVLASLGFHPVDTALVFGLCLFVCFSSLWAHDLGGVMALIGCTTNTAICTWMPCMMRLNLPCVEASEHLMAPDTHLKPSWPKPAGCAARVILVCALVYSPCAVASLVESWWKG